MVTAKFIVANQKCLVRYHDDITKMQVDLLYELAELTSLIDGAQKARRLLLEQMSAQLGQTETSRKLGVV